MGDHGMIIKNWMNLTHRPGTSDEAVLNSVFQDQCFACLEDLPEPQLIIDGGAYAGFSTVWFAQRWPKATVIAVEPDSDNYKLLLENTKRYPNVRPYWAGIWPVNTFLHVIDKKYRDGGHWTRQVAENSIPWELHGYTPLGLLCQTDCQRISLLKLDIEGAEVKLFSEGAREWLPLVDCIAVELHDDSHFGNATAAFYEAIEGQGFVVSHSGELTIAKRKGI